MYVPSSVSYTEGLSVFCCLNVLAGRWVPLAVLFASKSLPARTRRKGISSLLPKNRKCLPSSPVRACSANVPVVEASANWRSIWSTLLVVCGHCLCIGL